MRNENEPDLVRRAAGGDHDAFAALVDRYQRPLVNFAFRYLGQREDAEDAAQDAFVRTYFSLPRLRDPARFANYLFATALNICRRQAEKRRSVGAYGIRPLAGTGEAFAEATASMEGVFPASASVGEEPFDFAQDRLAPPEVEVLGAEEHEQIARAIAALPEEYREVVSLRVEGCLTFGEIGHMLGITEGACRVRYFRAREMLRSALAPAFAFEEEAP